MSSFCFCLCRIHARTTLLQFDETAAVHVRLMSGSNCRRLAPVPLTSIAVHMFSRSLRPWPLGFNATGLQDQHLLVQAAF